MKFEFSAGGVVYQQSTEGIRILIGQHSDHHGWVFPKGLIGDHNEKEGKEETAVREVQEETGITAKIIHALQPVTFLYSWEGEKRKKTVYYYVMEYVSGNTDDHDWEMEQVAWIPFDAVDRTLTYQTDKNVWKEAGEYIAKNTELKSGKIKK